MVTEKRQVGSGQTASGIDERQFPLLKSVKSAAMNIGRVFGVVFDSLDSASMNVNYGHGYSISWGPGVNKKSREFEKGFTTGTFPMAEEAHKRLTALAADSPNEFVKVVAAGMAFGSWHGRGEFAKHIGEAARIDPKASYHMVLKGFNDENATVSNEILGNILPMRESDPKGFVDVVETGLIRGMERLECFHMRLIRDVATVDKDRALELFKKGANFKPLLPEPLPPEELARMQAQQDSVDRNLKVVDPRKFLGDLVKGIRFDSWTTLGVFADSPEFRRLFDAGIKDEHSLVRQVTAETLGDYVKTLPGQKDFRVLYKAGITSQDENIRWGTVQATRKMTNQEVSEYSDVIRLGLESQDNYIKEATGNALKSAGKLE